MSSVTIQKVHATCSCTIVDCPSAPIEPEGHGKLDVRIRMENKPPGHHQFPITVECVEVGRNLPARENLIIEIEYHPGLRVVPAGAEIEVYKCQTLTMPFRVIAYSKAEPVLSIRSDELPGIRAAVRKRPREIGGAWIFIGQLHVHGPALRETRLLTSLRFSVKEDQVIT